ncbi:MAG: cupin domain-containing protein [Desulfobacterales bacterium]|nr:cupin domain-containing protein [Desulfobacterales bacterium]
MKIKHYSGIEPKHSEKATQSGITGRLVIGKGDGADNFCMRIFELSKNSCSPRHSHEWEHEIFIHSGKGEILSEGKWISVTSGYIIFIPGNQEHQIKNTTDQPLIFVCLIPAGVPEI